MLPAKYDVTMYTDGAASGNPGPGGYGVILMCNGQSKDFSEGFKHTTNNRMELLAVIRGLEELKVAPCNVIVFTDSKYVCDSVSKAWLFGWEKTGFKGKKNADLWLRFLNLYRKHYVKFQWIKGHNNNKWNEHCDQLAVKASRASNLTVDFEYENL